MHKIPMLLFIGGQYHNVLFDGVTVFDALFPDEPIQRIHAGCGMIICQEMLVEVCKQKLDDYLDQGGNIDKFLEK